MLLQLRWRWASDAHCPSTPARLKRRMSKQSFCSMSNKKTNTHTFPGAPIPHCRNIHTSRTQAAMKDSQAQCLRGLTCQLHGSLESRRIHTNVKLWCCSGAWRHGVFQKHNVKLMSTICNCKPSQAPSPEPPPIWFPLNLLFISALSAALFPLESP